MLHLRQHQEYLLVTEPMYVYKSYMSFTITTDISLTSINRQAIIDKEFELCQIRPE